MMGTVIRIVAEGADDRLVLSALDDAFAEFERLDRIFNRYDETSELARLNSRAVKKEVVASSELFELTSAALDYQVASLGAFDITVAPLIDLWRRCALEDRLPSAEEIGASQALTGVGKIELQPSRRGVRFHRDGVAMDFGGLAKGFAVDRAVEILRAAGLDRAFVDAGSSSMAGFAVRPPRWRIGVRHPLREDQLAGYIDLGDEALSSSGGDQRPLTIGRRSYSHIFDPRTGLPADGGLGATVVGDSAVRAEVMSKMVLLLGCEAAFARFEELGWKAEGLLMKDVGDGRIEARCSEGFTQFTPVAAAALDLPLLEAHST